MALLDRVGIPSQPLAPARAASLMTPPRHPAGPLPCRCSLIVERAANSGVSVLNATLEGDHAHLLGGFFLSGRDPACKSRSRGSSELVRGARKGAMQTLQEKR